MILTADLSVCVSAWTSVWVLASAVVSMVETQAFFMTITGNFLLRALLSPPQETKQYISVHRLSLKKMKGGKKLEGLRNWGCNYVVMHVL